MCGLAGIIAFKESGKSFLPAISEAVRCLEKRGPDDEGIYKDDAVALGHRRLSVIDVSHEASQPMTDSSGRYVIIFNGEFFNYRDHRNALQASGIAFRTGSDTEVLLNLYIKEGPDCLKKVNGFFALAIYDKQAKTLFVARDRFGVKPLLYFADEEKLFFASEVKALLKAGLKPVLNREAMHLYFQLNYVPPDTSMLQGVKKLKPGHYIYFSTDHPELHEAAYYQLDYQGRFDVSYADAQERFTELLDQSVQRRMVSDVPLGAFLSGGMDSSAIVALASRHTEKLNTYSIGFTDHEHFDETRYAEMVAGKFNTNHHVFRLNDDSFFDILFNVLDYIDEPFADSSALNVYILSRETRKHVTVALSGDGADEILGGYRKHKAEWLIRNKKWLRRALPLAGFAAAWFPGSRNNKLADKLRQINRFAEGVKLSDAERYWLWCCISPEQDVNDLLPGATGSHEKYIKHINNDFNSVLFADVQLVLPGDMLVKVDMMSMANSLEVRNPFLDFELVDFLFQLPAAFKINAEKQKRLLYDAFTDILPSELYHRRKQGFEVPLLYWFRTRLKSFIDEMLDDDFIRKQKIFNPAAISHLKRKLFSSHPGDAAARIWALIVFQYWYRKTFV